MKSYEPGAWEVTMAVETLITTYALFCPDCGTKAVQTGTSSLENQWCWRCPKCKAHLMRYSGRIEFIRFDLCEVCEGRGQ